MDYCARRWVRRLAAGRACGPGGELVLHQWRWVKKLAKHEADAEHNGCTEAPAAGRPRRADGRIDVHMHPVLPRQA